MKENLKMFAAGALLTFLALTPAIGAWQYFSRAEQQAVHYSATILAERDALP